MVMFKSIDYDVHQKNLSFAQTMPYLNLMMYDWIISIPFRSFYRNIYTGMSDSSEFKITLAQLSPQKLLIKFNIVNSN